MRTIIQHIGPLLGEVNTGSVFGQPNGSIANGQGFSPAPAPAPSLKNLWDVTRAIKNGEECMYIGTRTITTTGYTFWYVTLSATYKYPTQDWYNSINLLEDVADTTAHAVCQMATDEKFATIIASKAMLKGQYTFAQIPNYDPSQITGLTKGQTLYLRIALQAESGEMLGKYSNVLSYEYIGALTV